MKEIYEWLYDEYAEAALCQEPLFQDHVLSLPLRRPYCMLFRLLMHIQHIFLRLPLHQMSRLLCYLYKSQMHLPELLPVFPESQSLCKSRPLSY